MNHTLKCNTRVFVIDTLKGYLIKHPYRGDADGDLLKEMEDIEKTVFEEESRREPSLQNIPRFYFNKPNDHIMLQLLCMEAQKKFIESKNRIILNSDDLDHLWECLLNNASPPIINNDERIDYEGFSSVAKMLKPELSAEYCYPSLFLKFHKDERGRISIPNYFNYVLRKVSLILNRVTLSKYDTDADNYVSESNLERFILECIPKFPCLKLISKQFTKSYITIAVRKFCFFLDTFKRDRISIDEIVASPILMEFNELQNEDVSELELNENWFSLANAQGIYALFRQLNLTMSGSLSRNELRGFNNSSLTMTFIDRLLQEYGTKKGQLSFKMFVNFLIAYDNKNTPQSIQFFWPILDIDRRGYLTPFTINYFFRDILKKLQKNNAEVASIKDVNEEIYAMVMPKGDPLHITLQDLLDCKCGGTVVSMLIDVEAFWAYDNRESLATQNQ